MDKIYNVELTGYNIEQIIGSLNHSIRSLEDSKVGNAQMNHMKAIELKILRDYLETI